MTIRFRKKSEAEWLIYYILTVAMIASGLIEMLKVPYALKYSIDIAWILLGVLLFTNRSNRLSKDVRLMIVISLLFFFVAYLGCLKNFQSVLYNLWGLRNNVRFFVFFFACIFFLREESVDGIFKLIDILFWINIPVVLVQYFVMHKSQDYLGGIFGTQKGCNASMNVFLLLEVVYAILLYMHKRGGIKKCLIKCILSILIAALSELKVFFVELVVIVGFVLIVSKFSVRKLLLAVCVTIALIVGLRVVVSLFPSFSGWFSFEGIMKIIASDEGYTGTNDLNRLTAISQILKRYLNGTWESLFGLGLGNCDYASFDVLKTPFYQRHMRSHYIWFSTAFLVLETGIVGFGLYISFLGVVFAFARNRVKRRKTDIFYCQMAQIMAVMSVILCFYNVSLRTEAGYMVYFILALPFLFNTKQPLKSENNLC